MGWVYPSAGVWGMSVTDLSIFGLRIDSPQTTPEAANFCPPSWPPPADWPVSIDADGNVLSRWKDSIWHLDPWAGRAELLNFGDGHKTRAASIDAGNADLLRLVAGLLLWGPNAVQTSGTLRNQFTTIRPVFTLCAKEGILASQLMRFPRVADRIPTSLRPAKAEGLLLLLHRLFEHRDILGFTLLDREGLARLEAALPEHENKQTPYIPPRIWSYQVKRLRECLDDFLAHQQQIEACFRFCVGAYAWNYGSLGAAVSTKADDKFAPFTDQGTSSGTQSGRQFHGPFALTAQRFGIDELINRWLRAPGPGEQDSGIKKIAKYLSLVTGAAMAYIVNFSLMRIDEAWSLRASCLSIERDEHYGDISVLRGVTTKTQNDPDACWPTSASAQVAINALRAIAHLRMICTQAHPRVKLSREDIDNPYLFDRDFAPWSHRGKKNCNLSVRPTHRCYWGELHVDNSHLFDLDEMRITPEDQKLARLITPTLDSERYAVGQVWRITWHQLRRTGAVNMQASGLVSDSSVQYLLKHSSRAMSLYYGRNHSRLRINDEARTLFIRTMYEVLGKELVRLTSNRFVSPHGDKRKQEIVRLIAPEEVKKLSAMAKKGLLGCREVLLGYCVHREPCSYGGIDSVAHCGGGDTGTACADILFDTEKQAEIRELGRLLDRRLEIAQPDSPLQKSLLAQKRSIENYRHVIKA